MSGEESLDNPSDSHSLGWEGQWDCGGLGGTWESQGLPMVPLGVWDVPTGLWDSDGKLGHHSSIKMSKRDKGVVRQ